MTELCNFSVLHKEDLSNSHADSCNMRLFGVRNPQNLDVKYTMTETNNHSVRNKNMHITSVNFTK